MRPPGGSVGSRDRSKWREGRDGKGTLNSPPVVHPACIFGPGREPLGASPPASKGRRSPATSCCRPRHIDRKIRNGARFVTHRALQQGGNSLPPVLRFRTLKLRHPSLAEPRRKGAHRASAATRCAHLAALRRRRERPRRRRSVRRLVLHWRRRAAQAQDKLRKL